MNAKGKSRRSHPGRNEGAPEPDVLVGIDIGTTFTKVAYALRLEDRYEMKTMQNWSGFGCEDNETDCVPTILAYRKGENLLEANPSFYGKLDSEERRGDSLDVYEWFKEDFPKDLVSRTSSGDRDDTATRMSNPSAKTAYSTDTMVLYRHFLAKLRVAIKDEISAKLEEYRMPKWAAAHIDFIFSVPATWTGIAETMDGYTSKLEDAARSAHFNAISNHRVCIGLTEPEAAAASSMVTEFEARAASIEVLDTPCIEGEGGKKKHTPCIPKPGENILVVDAGGGTTDLCLINVHHANFGKLGIDNMTVPVGVPLGSSHIDRKFEELAKKRLSELSKQFNAVGEWDIDRLSQAMRYDPSFIAKKEALCFESTAGSEYFTMRGPNLSKYPESDTNPCVVNGGIKFTFCELADLFDEVIGVTKETSNGNQNNMPGINNLIHHAREQIRLQGTASSHDVDIILLAGGLGQSKYLKHRVEQAFREYEGPGARIPRVVTVADPQLSVCRGLVHNRIREIFSAQKCNGYYGILRETKFRYLKLWHLIAWKESLTTERGHKSFVREVEWIMEKGESIPITPRKYKYTFGKKEESAVSIVVSTDDKPGTLARSDRDYIAVVHCNRGELARDPKTKKRYCEVEFIFNVGKFDVKCWSPTKHAGELVGQYEGDFDKVLRNVPAS